MKNNYNDSFLDILKSLACKLIEVVLTIVLTLALLLIILIFTS